MPKIKYDSTSINRAYTNINENISILEDIIDSISSLNIPYDNLGTRSILLNTNNNIRLTKDKLSNYNEELLKEYRDLKDLYDKLSEYKKTEYKDKLEEIKKEKIKLSDIRKKLDKKSKEYLDLYKEEKDLKDKEKEFKEKVKKYEVENYTRPMSKFRSVTSSLKFYEILNNIELVIHVRSDDKTLKDIEENIYNLKSIGRSEDFVDILEAKIVNLIEDDDCDIISNYSAYLNYDDVIKGHIYFNKADAGESISGTKYYLNKNYKIQDGKRIFEKKAIYASQYIIEETSDNVFIDSEDNKEYIVNFI